MDLKAVIASSENKTKGIGEILFGKSNNYAQQFNDVKNNLGNIHREMALVEEAGKYFGEAGAKKVQVYIQSLKDLEVQADKSAQKIAKGFNLGNVNSVIS